MMNFNDLNQAQTAYVVEQIRKMGERYTDVCKDIQDNQEVFNKVVRLISNDVYENMLDQIENVNIITDSNLSIDDKCRSLIASWWTLSDKVDAVVIMLFLYRGEFDTKKHRAWISDAVRKPVDRSYMNRLAWILAVLIYATLYI